MISSVRNPVGMYLHSSQGRQVQTTSGRLGCRTEYGRYDSAGYLRAGETGRGKSRLPERFPSGRQTDARRSPGDGDLYFPSSRATFGVGVTCVSRFHGQGALTEAKWGWRLPLASPDQMRCQRWCFGTGREWASTLPNGNPKALGSLGRCQARRR